MARSRRVSLCVILKKKMAIDREKVLDVIDRFWRPGVIILGLALVALGLAYVFQSSGSSQIEVIRSDNNTAEKGEITVDLAGAVMNPGVYRLPNGSRVQDLLVVAGGLNAEADRGWVAKNVNLAALLADAGKIYIPALGEAALNQTAVAGVSAEAIINLNQADLASLQTLPGIGPSLAQRILDYRSSNGSFKSIEEIMAVPGIGPKLFEKIKSRLAI